MEIAKHCNVDPLVKWKKLSSENKNKIFYGDGKIIDFYNSYTGWSYNKIFNGVLGFLENKLKRSDLWQREELGKYLTKFECEACGGFKIKKEAMSIKINKCDINFISQLSIEKALIWFKDLDKTHKFSKEIASNIIKEIIDRLSFLNNVGLNYLQLSRSSSTLSGGESQRIRLASQIGSGLTGVLYVLDEPSIGLHQRDNKKLINTLKKLRDLGNSVLVVEHDEETILESDYVIDIGRGAGINGGNVVALEKPHEIKKTKTVLQDNTYQET